MNFRVDLDPDDLAPIVEAIADGVAARLASRLDDGRGSERVSEILLSKCAAAKALGVSVSTLDRLRREAGLPCVKLENLVLFRSEALRAWAKRAEGKTQ